MNHQELQQLAAAIPDVAIDYHDRIDSTNNHALNLARQGKIEQTNVVLAGEQTAGRGRGANAWWSTAGALTFSLVVPAEHAVQATDWPRLSLATGLAVCEVQEEFQVGPLVGLKWPNDVFVNGRKIAGILIETVVVPRPCLIVGIGLNVNNSFRQAPAELQQTATSMCDEMGHPFDRIQVLAAIIRRWRRQQMQLQLDRQSVSHAWQRYCILTGQIIRVEMAGVAQTGRCLGIDDEGALLLQTEQQIERIVAGTVRMQQAGG